MKVRKNLNIFGYLNQDLEEDFSVSIRAMAFN